MKSLNKDNYDAIYEKEIVFVDFWAGWCGPCMALAPLYEKVAQTYNSKAEFLKCNVDEEQELAVKHGIMSIPCIMVFNKGKLQDKLVGLANENILINFVERNLK